MSMNSIPPTLPIRPADNNSQYLAKGLLLAYPLVGGGTNVKNYGSWGTDGDLDLVNTTKTRRNGIASLGFDGISSVASNTSLSRSVPETWSVAYWIKMDSIPTTGENTIFSLSGSSGASMRVWADSQGLWCWQKNSIADSYSILPASDFPNNNMMLVIGVYEGSFLAPAQLRTNQGLTLNPAQPSSYTSFNSGIGIQSTEVTSISVGNSVDTTTPFSGTIGPLYFWNRPLSESEIWQLSQDPYAPFRRNSAQYLIPSTLSSTGGYSLQGVGKATDVSPVISDDSAIFINYQDYISYSNAPNDSLLSEAKAIDTITVNDTMSYVTIPTDHASGEAPFSLYTITINDDIAYSNLPVVSLIGPESGATIVPIVSVTDSIAYANLPTENVADTIDVPSSITVNDPVSYSNVPNETVASSQ